MSKPVVPPVPSGWSELPKEIAALKEHLKDFVVGGVIPMLLCADPACDTCGGTGTPHTVLGALGGFLGGGGEVGPLLCSCLRPIPLALIKKEMRRGESAGGADE